MQPICKTWFLLAEVSVWKGWSSWGPLWDGTWRHWVALWALTYIGTALSACGGTSSGGEAIFFMGSSSQLSSLVVEQRGWAPGGDECPRGGCAKKILLAAEQLASAANSDWLAQEDPNYSTTAVSIITAAGAVWARRH